MKLRKSDNLSPKRSLERRKLSSLTLFSLLNLLNTVSGCCLVVVLFVAHVQLCDAKGAKSSTCD